jgi:outer membrane protein assembly factor BamB
VRIAPARKRLFTAVAVIAALLIAAGGVLGVGLVRGWFDSGTVEGTTEGFDPAAAPQVSEEPGSWPEYGYNSERTRANTALTGLRPPYRRAWEYDAGSLVEFSPVLAEGRAIFGTNHKRAIALDMETGRELWSDTLRGRIASSPAIAGDLALFTSIRGEVIAFDAATGRRVWERRLGAAIESSPLVIGDSFYIGTLAGRVLRMAVANGRIEWTARARCDVKASLARAGDTVVVGDYGGHITAYRMSDGAVAWQRESPGTQLSGPGRFYAGPAVAYGRIFLGNINGRVLAMDAEDGRTAWVRVFDDFVYSSAAIANRLVYVGSYDTRFYALDAVTGRTRWSFDAGERISGSATVIGEVVYVSTIGRNPPDGRTFMLDAGTGRRLATFPDGRYSPAVAADEDLLVLTGVSTVYGLRPR